MAMFKIEIVTDKSAFGVNPHERADELGRILRELAADLATERSPEDGEQGILRDYNSNTVGYWEMLGDE